MTRLDYARRTEGPSEKDVAAWNRGQLAENPEFARLAGFVT